VAATTSPSPQQPAPRLWIALGVLLVLVAGAAWRYLRVPSEKAQRVQDRKDMILKEVDQIALRDACRATIVKYGRPGLARMKADDPRVPPIVRRLEPTEVLLTQHYLRIEMGDAQLNYGLESFRDRMHQVPFPTSRELQEGLWYYDSVRPDMIERFPS
jgi:hypothetical protein